MGLDILLKTPIEPTETNKSLIEDYRNHVSEYVVTGIEGATELAIFEKYLYKKDIVYDNWEDTFQNKGLKVEDYEWCSLGEEPTLDEVPTPRTIDDYWWKFRNKETDEILWINYNEIVTFTKEEDCILAREIGYQRKGANKQFYDDGMWDSPCVIDEKTIKEHWEKYFSETPKLRKDFYENIVKKFKDGETFVLYA